MRKSCWISGIMVLAVSAQPALCQGTTGGTMTSGTTSGSSTTTGASTSTGQGIGQGTTSGQGALFSLNPTTNSGAATGGGGAGRGATSTSNAVPNSNDPFLTTYNNPYATGLSNVSTAFSYNTTSLQQLPAQTGFGTPVFGAAPQNTTKTQYSNINNGGFSTVGAPRTPPYAVALTPNIPRASHAPQQLQAQLHNSLQNAPFLKNKSGISVAVDGSTVYLKGRVASDKERRVAEGIARLTPGVRDVVNELVAPTAPAILEANALPPNTVREITYAPVAK